MEFVKIFSKNSKAIRLLNQNSSRISFLYTIHHYLFDCDRSVCQVFVSATHLLHGSSTNSVDDALAEWKNFFSYLATYLTYFAANTSVKYILETEC